MMCTSPMTHMEMDQQGQVHLHPEPCVIYGSTTNFPQHNINTILPPHPHHPPEHHSYGMNPYNGVQHHYLAGNVATSSNHYNMHMTPSSGTRVFPGPTSQGPHGPHDQLPFASSYGINETSADSYRRDGQFVDGVGGIFKRKNAEGIPGNLQYCPTSSVASMSGRPLESDAILMDGASSSAMDVGSHRRGRNISGGIGVDSVLPHNTNRMVHGNHVGQPFQTAGTPWLNQHFTSNGGDMSPLSWNNPPSLPYLHGNINGGCMEAANMGIQGYQVTASNRNSMPYLHPPSMPQGHPNLHHPPLPPPMQGVRGQNINFHSQVATSLCRLPTNSTSRTSTSPFQGGIELGNRLVGPSPPTGLRIYRPRRRDAMLEATSRHRNLPHLRVLPEDGVAILEVSGYHEVGGSVDSHRDMRLDIDHMSYEELLALGEHIGSVGSGLSEKIVTSHIKSRTFVISTSCLNQEKRAYADQELNFCVICQNEYKDQEKIGVLNCGHEYHVDCIKKWLVVKNVCPICKSPGLTTGRKES